MDTTVSLTDLNFALLAFGCRAIRCQSLRVGLGGQDRDLDLFKRLAVAIVAAEGFALLEPKDNGAQ
ncbi:MAG TPA: hypothetical protein VKG24_27730 [Pseudolabrys sp.]|nr:hypothetical protein [Pseudolabrys sp.]